MAGITTLIRMRMTLFKEPIATRVVSRGKGYCDESSTSIALTASCLLTFVMHRHMYMYRKRGEEIRHNMKHPIERKMYLSPKDIT